MKVRQSLLPYSSRRCLSKRDRCLRLTRSIYFIDPKMGRARFELINELSPQQAIGVTQHNTFVIWRDPKPRVAVISFCRLDQFRLAGEPDDDFSVVSLNDS